jgi:C1A family cysteine protease
VRSPQNSSRATASKPRPFYCDDEDRGQNHEVAVVGWDDAYPNTSFKTPARETERLS